MINVLIVSNHTADLNHRELLLQHMLHLLLIHQSPLMGALQSPQIFITIHDWIQDTVSILPNQESLPINRTRKWTTE
jgi:hypothetical protein